MSNLLQHEFKLTAEVLHAVLDKIDQDLHACQATLEKSQDQLEATQSKLNIVKTTTVACLSALAVAPSALIGDAEKATDKDVWLITRGPIEGGEHDCKDYFRGTLAEAQAYASDQIHYNYSISPVVFVNVNTK